MHTTINYSKYTGLEQKVRAIADVKDWLGEARFDKLTAEFRAIEVGDRPNLKQFESMCDIAGIQGYPVQVWYEYIFSPATDPAIDEISEFRD